MISHLSLQSPSERSVELVDELYSSSSDLCSSTLSCCNEAYSTVVTDDLTQTFDLNSLMRHAQLFLFFFGHIGRSHFLSWMKYN